MNFDLNADHFSSLVRMRTKSAIADFYGSSVYIVSACPRLCEEGIMPQIYKISLDASVAVYTVHNLSEKAR